MKIDKKILELEHEEVSLRERVDSIEWEIMQRNITGKDNNVALLDERRKAADKLRHVRREILEMKIYKLDGSGFKQEDFNERT